MGEKPKVVWAECSSQSYTVLMKNTINEQHANDQF